MFPQQPQQQFRTTNADVQFFYRNATWNKPPGVSFIYMMLIGGGGTSANGGGSGAVTVWFGAAQHVPDSLVLSVSTGAASNTVVNYRGANGLNALLTANAGETGSVAAGAAMAANPFTTSGFFQSTAGQNGSTTVTPSTTTFLSGGGSTVTANYGYETQGAGYFQLQPIIVGIGGEGGGSIIPPGGIGCGGSRDSGVGGPGLIIIASW